MNIEKGKIVEVLSENGNKVIKYTQLLKNKDLNQCTEVEGENLNILLNRVRNKVNHWDNY